MSGRRNGYPRDGNRDEPIEVSAVCDYPACRCVIPHTLGCTEKHFCQCHTPEQIYVATGIDTWLHHAPRLTS